MAAWIATTAQGAECSQRLSRGGMLLLSQPPPFQMIRSRLRDRCSPELMHTKKGPSDEPCLPGPQREGVGQSHRYHSEIRGNLLPFLDNQ